VNIAIAFVHPERANRLREQTACGNPKGRSTIGLVAYLDGELVGCARLSRA